mgnify:CR=1 FL=1
MLFCAFLTRKRITRRRQSIRIMDSRTITEILVMAFLILMSAYFSATETAFSSLNRTRLKTMAEKGSKRAVLACRLSESYDKLLSTILIGNNIVNIATASIGTVLFVRLYGDIGATLSTVVITIVVLIFGEITPKSIAKDCPEKFAMFSAPLLRLLMWLLTPVNFLFSQWKRLIAKLLRLEADTKMSQEELLMLVEEVEEGGSIDRDEGELLRSAIEFTEREADDILTHRTEMEAVSADTLAAEVARRFAETKFSRIPVYEDTIDNIIGVIHEKDFHAARYHGQEDVSAIVSNVLYTTGSTKISDLLRILQRAKAHMVIVVDEYGGTEGLVTLEDIVEELVGEIWDEHDEVIEEFRKQSDGSYLVACSADLDDLYDLFDMKPSEEYDASTVSGWVMEEIGRVPDVGDRFQADGLDVCVTRVEHRRVMEIRVRPLPPEKEEPEKAHAHSGT